MPITPATAPLSDLDKLYNVAVWMFDTLGRARAATLAVSKAHPGLALEGRLGYLLRPLLGQPSPGPRDGGVHRLRVLDDVLRSSATIPVDADHPLVRGELWRLRALESELKVTCLWSVLRALAPMQRGVFVLASMLGYSSEQIAAICGSTLAGVDTARRRATRQLEDYLGARCEHIDPRNMCHCRARLGVALAKGFLDWHDRDTPITTDAAPAGDVFAVYGGLPRFRLDGPPTRPPR